MRRRKEEAATGATVAARLNAPDGARFQLHFTPNSVARQGPRPGRLQRLAEAAKIRSDCAALWRLRRQLLLLQAALYGEEVP